MTPVTRREVVRLLGTAGAAAGVAACLPDAPRRLASGTRSDPVLAVRPLGTPWQTSDPFLFCVHHDDRYPAGNTRLGPSASLEGRIRGRDFAGKDGWRMYHGDQVPGFPAHPHRGFETVTLVRRGLLDHSDSLGATARYGGGDVQWLTAGRGIQHAEMFPLVEQSGDNPLELFQIWLNLPATNKMVDPHFSMSWDAEIPRHVVRDARGRVTVVRVVAGRLDDQRVPPPPPRSWAALGDSDVAIWTVKMAAGAQWSLPAAAEGTNRTVYFFRGSGLRIADRSIPVGHEVRLRPRQEAPLVAGPDETELLVLQGRPIGEPVERYGPFVMNTKTEIRQAVEDFRETRFGGWPWSSAEPVHARQEGRFARHATGRTERPT